MKFVSAAHLTGGGTITGDLTISGDLTVNGDGSGNYDEIVNGNLQVGSADRSATIRDTQSDATVPSFTFTGDTNTGMGSSAANTINFITDGGTRMILDAYGKVGIGDTSPGARLEINESTGNTPALIAYHSSGNTSAPVVKLYGDSASNTKEILLVHENATRSDLATPILGVTGTSGNSRIFEVTANHKISGSSASTFTIFISSLLILLACSMGDKPSNNTPRSALNIIDSISVCLYPSVLFTSRTLS